MSAPVIKALVCLIAGIMVAGAASGQSADPLTSMLIESGLDNERAVHTSIYALLDKQDYKLIETFEVGQELVGYALLNESDPRKSLVLYETKDGYLIHGNARDPDGKPITLEHRFMYLPDAANERHAAANAEGFLIAEGNGSIVLDVFLDPQCTYCKKLWTDLRSELDVVTVNWRPIAMYPGSLSQVASLMLSADPAGALAKLVRFGTMERHQTTPDIVAGVRNNTQRMQKAKMTQTPSGFIRLPNGQVQPFQGASVIQQIRSLRY